MDLSLLSDAEILEIDKRIHALWKAPMRVLLDDPPKHGVLGRAGQVRIRADSTRIGVQYQVNLRNLWWTARSADECPIARPRSADEAFDAWCELVGYNVRKMYRSCGRSIATPCIVCKVELTYAANPADEWLGRNTLVDSSLARVARILEEDSESDE